MIKLDKLKVKWRMPILLFGILAVIWSTSCEIDDFTTAPPSGVAPEVSITSNDTVNFDQDFVLTAAFADATAGLGTATFSLFDSTGSLLFEEEVFLIGTADTVSVTVDSGTVLIGLHLLRVTAFDTEGLSTSAEQDVFAKGILQNNDAMFFRGSFNGWGADEMSLVDDYTWATAATLTTGDEFKFANTDNWSDLDWGDENCDGVAQQGGGNAAGCVPADGPYRITFNDNTLAYELKLLTANNAEMYMKGAFNGWSNDNQMYLVDDFTWETVDVAITVDQGWKFANTGDWSDTDWGDDNCDGVAVVGNGDVFCDFEGLFTVHFNDQTFEYQFIAQ